jgi:hypothetical protein
MCVWNIKQSHCHAWDRGSTSLPTKTILKDVHCLHSSQIHVSHTYIHTYIPYIQCHTWDKDNTSLPTKTILNDIHCLPFSLPKFSANIRTSILFTRSNRLLDTTSKTIAGAAPRFFPNTICDGVCVGGKRVVIWLQPVPLTTTAEGQYLRSMALRRCGHMRAYRLSPRVSPLYVCVYVCMY